MWIYRNIKTPQKDECRKLRIPDGTDFWWDRIGKDSVAKCFRPTTLPLYSSISIMTTAYKLTFCETTGSSYSLTLSI